MKPITEVTFGFSDAENYRRRENRDLFNRIFLRTEALERLCARSTFFLVGEKGTGKTAYAVYFSNSSYKQHLALHRFIRETDYQKFIALKEQKNLSISDYADIWKVIIYLLLSDAIVQKGGAGFLGRFTKFKALRDAIDEYYNHAFSPEIPSALQFVEDSKVAAELVAKHSAASAKIGADRHTQRKTSESRFQTNLLFLERNFEDCLSSLKLTDNYLLFIDGIDIRPNSVPYNEYLGCVKGLANAIWSVNNDFFPTIRDSVGRLRVVLLVRPDIFNSLGLQNRNTKLRDNSVILDWRTNYSNHRSSEIFALADRMFSAQQDEPMEVGGAWDHYFPFDAASVHSEQKELTSFIVFLRYSFYRPRDILTILDVLHKLYVRPDNPLRVFTYEDLFTPVFRRAYGDYLLGEIKDSLSFYYDEEEFEVFLKFFEFLEGSNRFTYEKYSEAYANFSMALDKQNKPLPPFMKSEEEFLQFIYDLGIISFIEYADDERFIRWSFVERSPTNLSPKVKTDMEYEIHYGLANVLNTGKAISRRRKSRKVEVDAKSTRVEIGRVKWFNHHKGYGFIVQEGSVVDIYFSRSGVDASVKNIRRGQSVQFSLAKDEHSGKTIATNVRPAPR